MSHFLEYAGLRRSVLAFTGTVYGFVVGVADWLLDFSDEDNSFYLALF